MRQGGLRELSWDFTNTYFVCSLHEKENTFIENEKRFETARNTLRKGW
jgi:hypothetical protein